MRKTQNIFITERDRKLFLKIQSCGFLSTRQIKKMIYPETNRRTMLSRLRRLHRTDYLRYVTGNFGEFSWYLTAKAAMVFGDTPTVKSINRNKLTHDLLVNEVRFFIEDLGYGTNWISAHIVMKNEEKKKPYERYLDYEKVPDWFCILDMHHGKKGVSIEVELHYKGASKMVDLFNAYASLKNIDYCWYFVRSEEFGRRLMRDFKLAAGQKNPEWLWFSVIDDIKKDKENMKIYFSDKTHLLKNIFVKQQEKKKLTYQDFMNQKEKQTPPSPPDSVRS